MSAAAKTAGAKRVTGWVRYRICDRSGGGWERDRWHFWPGVEQYGKDEIREQIIAERETWAVHAESYKWQHWLHETPPIELLEATIAAKERSIAAELDDIKTLRRQISLKRELTTI